MTAVSWLLQKPPRAPNYTLVFSTIGMSFNYEFLKVNIIEISFVPGTYNVKVKQFHNRPGVAQRVPGGLGSQIS
jgi:hypothetical protein